MCVAKFQSNLKLLLSILETVRGILHQHPTPPLSPDPNKNYIPLLVIIFRTAVMMGTVFSRSTRTVAISRVLNSLSLWINMKSSTFSHP